MTAEGGRRVTKATMKEFDQARTYVNQFCLFFKKKDREKEKVTTVTPPLAKQHNNNKNMYV